MDKRYEDRPTNEIARKYPDDASWRNSRVAEYLTAEATNSTSYKRDKDTDCDSSQHRDIQQSSREEENGWDLLKHVGVQSAFGDEGKLQSTQQKGPETSNKHVQKWATKRQRADNGG